ncbi:universal stress protein [Legionella parisiensis]|uniref:Putative universal stress protein n=1 Tax=Legionella parisiensis TaxID=45071 RepID=A0A1E5JR52_9GAMM|nr:universal stress protein [Legionella parisiensis]KTD44417.1 universal stress family protein [Legionella parisiensis]OEH46528.1 putative universal stress protein [Legionella parisiensis]STX72045.1 universal stress family protein [Legionella parisiensis]
MIFNNLLIASDFSKHADWALQRAINLAKSNQAQIHFLHVITTPLSDIAQFSDTELQAHFLSEKKEIEGQILKKLTDTRTLIAKTKVVFGKAANEIVRYADENHCELIVAGAHGRYYINEYVLGTTSGSIISQSHVPVLLVKKEPDFTYKRIVIATDLSETSRETVQFTFKSFPHATFQLLHIIDIHHKQFFNPADLIEEFVDIDMPKTKGILEKMDDFLKQCHVDKSRFDKKIIGGYYADCIIRQAQKWNADLLAFGTQSKSRLHYLLMGSVAKRILHLSTVDMLAVPPKLPPKG